jgi:hypothetical protein
MIPLKPLTPPRHQLFRTSVKVQPTSGEHPLFVDFEYGILSVFLFAEHDFDAQERALKIVSYLPYDLATVEVLTTPFTTNPDEVHDDAHRPYLINAIDEVMHKGVAFYLQGRHTLTDSPELKASFMGRPLE